MKPAAATALDRRVLETSQLGRLRALLTAVLAGNDFYRAKLAGLDANLDSLETFQRRVPFTFKRELTENQAQYPPYGTNLTYPLERYTRYHQTSGTTGAPMRWLDTPESWAWMLDCWEQVYRATGVGRDDHIFFAFGFGPFLGFWTAFEAAARLGCLVIPGGGMRSVTRLRTILDNGATVLCATPTYALRLAEVAAEEQINLGAARVRRIIVGGEPGGSIPATRARIEQLWPGARVVDHHGMTEVGPVSYECPRRAGVLHIMEAAYLPEVIHPDSGLPVDAGQTGELVLTNLGRDGSPLLRYRTGDVVRRAHQTPCRCGSHEMALEGGILGRTDDMLIVRGVNLYPSAIEEIVRSCGAVAEFLVQVTAAGSLPEVSIQLEPAGEDGDGLVRRVAAALENAFGLRIPVTPAARGSLPRFEGKARRWAAC